MKLKCNIEPNYIQISLSILYTYVGTGWYNIQNKFKVKNIEKENIQYPVYRSISSFKSVSYKEKEFLFLFFCFHMLYLKIALKGI